MKMWQDGRILPEVQRVHHFKATRLERSIAGRYAAEDGGHFSPHRDNTARGRRYAFLYDDEAARQRLAKNAFLGNDVPVYGDPELGTGPATSDII